MSDTHDEPLALECLKAELVHRLHYRGAATFKPELIELEATFARS